MGMGLVEDQGASHQPIAAFALLLQDKYGSQCKTLEEEHLDQAIEQEVRGIHHLAYCRFLAAALYTPA